jgi:hypothetical protein
MSDVGLDLGVMGDTRIIPGGELGSVGTVFVGRVANEATLRAARRHWLEASPDDFAVLADGGWVDKGSGQVYELLQSDPLFAPNPHELASLFTVVGERIIFLRKKEGVTLETLARDRAEQARDVEKAAEQERRFREKQPKAPVTMAQVYGDRFAISLRRAAELVLDAGGTIERDEWGGIRVSLPTLLVGEPLLEQDARKPLLEAAEVLSAGRRVVVAVLDDAEGARSRKKPRLDERLPDKPVTIGGGVA